MLASKDSKYIRTVIFMLAEKNAMLYCKHGGYQMSNETSLQVKGGRARAKKLSAEERKAIARNAADARWGKDLPKATHEGTLIIGEMEIPCAVLEDGTRVLTQSGVMVALGRSRQAKGRDYYDADVN